MAWWRRTARGARTRIRTQQPPRERKRHVWPPVPSAHAAAMPQACHCTTASDPTVINFHEFFLKISKKMDSNTCNVCPIFKSFYYFRLVTSNHFSLIVRTEKGLIFFGQILAIVDLPPARHCTIASTLARHCSRRRAFSDRRAATTAASAIAARFGATALHLLFVLYRMLS